MEIIFFITILILIFFAYGYYLPQIKGIIGESRVSRKLENLNLEEFKVLNDILLITSNGFSQIDHIVVSIYGIFVIETKNYTGWIHGNENSEYWIQTIYKKKTKFRNPIKQNWSHIYALKEVLSEYKQAIYHPIVVFTGSAELKNITSKVPVIYKHQLIQVISDKKNNINLSNDQVNNIVDKLNEIRIADKHVNKDHIHSVKNHIHELKQKEKLLNCPRCGSELATRKGPYGNFYGCLNYPKCNYTRQYKAK